MHLPDLAGHATDLYVCIYVCACVCLFVCVCMCVSVCVYTYRQMHVVCIPFPIVLTYAIYILL